jgi:hypothetical protein
VRLKAGNKTGERLDSGWIVSSYWRAPVAAGFRHVPPPVDSSPHQRSEDQWANREQECDQRGWLTGRVVAACTRHERP